MVSDATRVLVIDQDHEGVQLVRRLLGGCGRPYLVDAAHDVRHVPGRLADGAYHVCLIEHRLGDRLGHEVLGMLPDRRHHPPMVVLTSCPDPALTELYLHNGADDFLRKDEVTPDLLDRTIRFAVAHWRSREKAAAEAQALRRRERMATICRFANAVAHEYNNLDAVLLAGMERLFLKASDDPETKAQVERVVGAIERGRRISRALLQLGRASNPDTGQCIDLQRQLTDGVAIVRSEVERAGVDFHAQMTAATCPVGLAVAEAHHLIAHLVGNALHAVHAARQPQVRMRLERLADSAVLVVADNGIGIAPEDQAQVFEPFFTRKGTAAGHRCFPPTIQGAGLGLSVCLALVERAGGSISLSSTPGAGTTVTVRLPIRVPPPAPAVVRTPAPAATARALRVAVLEDNANLRDLIGGALRDVGWEVHDHGDPREFLASDDPAWGDLLLLDWGLPGMDGAEVLTALAQLPRPSPLRVIVMSGGNTALPQSLPRGVQVVDSLEKPFRMQALVQAIRNVV